MKPFASLAKCACAILMLTVAGVLNAPARAADGPVWTEDYAAALKAAKKDHKMLLLDFTGSDWCPYCIQLTKEVFGTPEFARWVSNKFLLVELDYPNEKPQTAAVKQQNKQMKDKYAITGYPTVIILDSDEKELARSIGYGGEKPDEWIKARDADIAKAQAK
jgi:thioredoxin-related protein